MLFRLLLMQRKLELVINYCKYCLVDIFAVHA